MNERFTGRMALAFLAGCAAQEQKSGEDAGAELRQAKEAATQEIQADLDAAKKNATDLRSNLSQLDEQTAKVYHDTLDELDEAQETASTHLEKAGQASEDAWSELGKAAKEQALQVRERSTGSRPS